MTRYGPRSITKAGASSAKAAGNTLAGVVARVNVNSKAAAPNKTTAGIRKLSRGGPRHAKQTTPPAHTHADNPTSPRIGRANEPLRRKWEPSANWNASRQTVKPRMRRADINSRTLRFWMQRRSICYGSEALEPAPFGGRTELVLFST